ncbi:unnamed protein product [Symbiodinium pilosum]|uniref:Uncharacterized protein n=1 Tax=Symbiodinium pilosum TaxID=2952 RepID=A0A812P8V6_SYMPI|nr:unnamed protein product [Symbiodinium pilosum]
MLLTWHTGMKWGRNYQFFECFSGLGRVSKRMHWLGYRVASFDMIYDKAGSGCMSFLGAPGFMLCVYVILNQVPEALSLFAPMCASWGAPNRGTSMRSVLNPSGQMNYRSVQEANTTVSRMTLLALLILSRNGLFLVENPMQTLLQWHRRWQWLCNRVCYVAWPQYAYCVKLVDLTGL